MELANDKELLLIVAKIEVGTIAVPTYSNVDFKFNKYIFCSYIEETKRFRFCDCGQGLHLPEPKDQKGWRAISMKLEFHRATNNPPDRPAGSEPV